MKTVVAVGVYKIRKRKVKSYCFAWCYKVSCNYHNIHVLNVLCNAVYLKL